MTPRHTGSSPRGRGKRARWPRIAGKPRLIPARAGKTAASDPCARSTRAHPRAGGENGTLAATVVVTGGSSPRGRGKRAGVLYSLYSLGLIPARAGKTLTAHNLQRMIRAHPRAGGENRVFPSRNECTSGSSPRGRGKHLEYGYRGVLSGLIPARAGKTTVR